MSVFSFLITYIHIHVIFRVEFFFRRLYYSGVYNKVNVHGITVFMGSRTNARMGRVDRNWTKSGGRLSPMARGFVSG